MNARHLAANPGDSGLAARIASYELAGRMQLSVPGISDLSTEPAHILKMYGADDEANADKAAFAKNCILARRLIEKGVRFVQLFNGAYASGGKLNWDGHNALKEQYDVHAGILDQPAAALIRDLKQRGLLEDTLVVWCTEFGRMPFFQKGSFGRDHNPDGFTCWLAGAGVKAGVSHGVTDELGRKAIVPGGLWQTSGIVNRGTYSVQPGTYHFVPCYSIIPTCTAPFEYVLFMQSTYRYVLFPPSTYRVCTSQISMY
jgi:hypothetical protein